MPEFDKRLACVIAADGKIARGYMIDKCEFNGVNEYIVTWKVPLQGAAKNQLCRDHRQRAGRTGRSRLDYGRPDEGPIPVAGSYLRSKRKARGATFSYCLLPRSVSKRISAAHLLVHHTI